MKYLILLQAALALYVKTPDIETGVKAYSAKEPVYSAKSAKEAIEIPEDINPLDKIMEFPVLPPIVGPQPIINPRPVTEVNP